MKKINLLLICLLLILNSCSLFRSDRKNFENLLLKHPDWVTTKTVIDTIVVKDKEFYNLDSNKTKLDSLERTIIDLIRPYNDTIIVNKIKKVFINQGYKACIGDTIRLLNDSVSLKIYQANKNIVYELKLSSRTKNHYITKQTTTIKSNNKFENYTVWLIVIILVLLFYIFIQKFYDDRRV